MVANPGVSGSFIEVSGSGQGVAQAPVVGGTAVGEVVLPVQRNAGVLDGPERYGDVSRRGAQAEMIAAVATASSATVARSPHDNGDTRASGYSRNEVASVTGGGVSHEEGAERSASRGSGGDDSGGGDGVTGEAASGGEERPELTEIKELLNSTLLEGDVVDAVVAKYGSEFIDGLLPDGVSLEALIRAENPNMPKLLLAGRVRDRDNLRALRRGAGDLIKDYGQAGSKVDSVVGEMVADYMKHILRIDEFGTMGEPADDYDRLALVWELPAVGEPAQPGDLLVTYYTWGDVSDAAYAEAEARLELGSDASVARRAILGTAGSQPVSDTSEEQEDLEALLALVAPQTEDGGSEVKLTRAQQDDLLEAAGEGGRGTSINDIVSSVRTLTRQPSGFIKRGAVPGTMTVQAIRVPRRGGITI